MANPKITSVVISDDHAIIRDAINTFLESIAVKLDLKFHVSAFAKNGLDTIAAIKTYKPDIIFLDISMPLASGAEIIHDIKRWSPNTKIIVLTGITSPGLLASIIESGVEGLFSKGSPIDILREKIPLILQGGRHVASELLEIIKQGHGFANLTSREHQVLNMIVAGKTNRDIASALFISPKTVDKHRTSLMAKLDVHSVAELLSHALKEGLIDPSI